jgi:hypothetical protein
MQPRQRSVADPRGMPRCLRVIEAMLSGFSTLPVHPIFTRTLPFLHPCLDKENAGYQFALYYKLIFI